MSHVYIYTKSTCNVVASEVMVRDTCVLSLIVIGTTLTSFSVINILPIAVQCLRIFLVA